MFELVLVVRERLVGFSVDPHVIDDFEPALSRRREHRRDYDLFDDDGGSRVLPGHSG
ncbi:MAG: hypothetical protein JOY96_08715 [Verrucomicrobia bacterium]|nr:hypothetical protein [Verrucomicrobiota bacterium]